MLKNKVVTDENQLEQSRQTPYWKLINNGLVCGCSNCTNISTSTRCLVHKQTEGKTKQVDLLGIDKKQEWAKVTDLDGTDFITGYFIRYSNHGRHQYRFCCHNWLLLLN